MQIEIFYDELNGQTRTIVDVVPGGTLMAKNADVAYSLLDDVATNNYQRPRERSSAKRVAGLYEMDPIIPLQLQLKLCHIAIKQINAF